MKVHKLIYLAFILLVTSTFFHAQAGPRFNGLVYRPVTDAERLAFINSYGTTGTLLNHRYFMTAEHSCDANGLVPIRSDVRDQLNTFVGVRLVEAHIDYDVCIFEISWAPSKELPKNIVLPRRIWTQKEQVIDSSGPVREVLYSFGMGRFGRPHYSESSLLELFEIRGDIHFLKFNLSSESGSSGGPVIRKSDGLLVSLISGPVNGNPHGTFEPENQSAWVMGPALYEVYGQSPILQKIFPNGSNIFANSAGRPFVNGNKTYDINGKVDLVHGRSYSISSSPKERANKEYIWRQKNRQWGLFSFSLRPIFEINKGNSCEGMKKYFGQGADIPDLFQRWRTPTQQELDTAIKNGLADPSKNLKFGAHFYQFQPSQIGVRVDQTESITCDDTYGLIQKDAEPPSWYRGSENMKNDCLQICIRD